jgi:hypothetical protein
LGVLVCSRAALNWMLRFIFFSNRYRSSEGMLIFSRIWFGENGVDAFGKVYLVHALPQDYLSRKDGGLYSRENYYEHPGNYRSDFHTKVGFPFSLPPSPIFFMV